jgi:anti-sigma regulatory factor (Ser/Thr protein kinase)
VLDSDFDAATLHLLRKQVTACAMTAGMSRERASDITLVVSELAANTVKHGPGRGQLRMRLAGGVLRCLVRDAGPDRGTWPVRQGHGLWIVQAIADQVTISADLRGSLVTAVFAIP